MEQKNFVYRASLKNRNLFKLWGTCLARRKHLNGFRRQISLKWCFRRLFCKPLVKARSCAFWALICFSNYLSTVAILPLMKFCFWYYSLKNKITSPFVVQIWNITVAVHPLRITHTSVRQILSARFETTVVCLLGLK